MNFDSSVLQIPIEDIIPNRFQPRRSFDDESLQELADSIRQHGIIQPLVLRPNGDKYEIVAGERRYKASIIAGLASVPAVIARISDRQSAETSIVENIQRKALTAIEEAQSYKALLEKGYMSQEELAKRMGLSQSAISNKLRLLTLSQNVQDAVLENRISERHARSLLKLKSQEAQDTWLNRIIDERLTVKQLDDLIKAEIQSEEANVPEDDRIIKTKVVERPENFEDMEVSMSTEESNSDLIDSLDSFGLQTERKLTENDPFAKILEKAETPDIDSLDFLPPSDPNNQLLSDVSYLTDRIDNLLREIGTDNHVTQNKTDNGNIITYTININKKNQETLS